MMRASLLVLALCAVPTRADADIVVVYGSVEGGGMVGEGTGGDQKGEDFFKNAPNGAYGATVAGKFLFLAAELSHHQYTFFGGELENSLRTWTQFAAGIDFDVNLGTEVQKKARQGKFIHLSALAGFGLGTGQQVNPPLDNSQVTDKGFIVGGKLGLGTHVSKYLDFGVMVPLQYHYMFKNGVAANDVNNHYQGFAIEALLFLRIYIKII
jgi:hypothetical protein